MGGCMSCRSSSSSSSSSSPSSFDCIRLIHFNGAVQDFEDPITVGDITGKPPKYFVCTPSQLISFSSSETLQPETQLQRGQIYFILPLSALQWEASPVDFVCLATRLNKVAKRSGSIKAKNPQKSPVMDPLEGLRRSKSTPERVLNPISEQVVHVTSVGEKSDDVHVRINRDKMNYRAQSWKPILQTINERSFGRRSESDLQTPRIA
ncbi:uncharacterized protein LOC122081678 [Macadamia integrifolia]|uniref:uncharacterized protein LOC122081678 n=1 Tax=Macadamia integrifolia TaxID=60698 RepID=UPI001C4F932E|nr:uncharacterized protein LOC122081678 [Macadamia integrifolia]